MDQDYMYYDVKVLSTHGVEYTIVVQKIPGESIFATARKALQDGETLVDENNA